METGREVGDGLLLREATVDDAEQLIALNVAAFGEPDACPVQAHVLGPGADPAWWLVVAEGATIVAASARLPLTAHIDGVAVPGCQIEWVATDRRHQRRGLVRAMFDRHHECSAAAGELLSFIGGIPYFYRRFGYGYGLDYPDLFIFDQSDLRPDPSVSFRHASGDDAALLAAVDGPTPATGVRVARAPGTYARWIAMCEPDGANQLWIAERAGVPVAWVRYLISEDEQRLEILPTTVPDDGVADAIVQHGFERARGFTVVAATEPGTFGARVRTIGAAVPYGLGIFARVTDPIVLLDRLRPALTARLAAARAPAGDHLDISLYEQGVRLHFRNDTVTEVSAVPGVEDPFDTQSVGVAPDWFPALVLGRWGANGLAERCDDVTLGRHASLMESLFPRLDADVITHF